MIRHLVDRTLRRPVAAAALLGAIALAVVPALARSADDAPSGLTLAEALQTARQANAQLPVARLQWQGAEARVHQARGQRYPTLSLEGDVHDGTPHRYASGDAMLAIFLRGTLYDGGRLGADLQRSRAEADVLHAGYRVAQRDLDQAVRLAFGRVLRAEASREFRRHTLERLRAYASFIEARQSGGQGVGQDLLLARQRLAAAEADTAAVARDLVEARMELNDLLGRDPVAPLVLAPLPPPVGPAVATGEPWKEAPDVAAASDQVRAAQADVQAARAGRRPQVTLEANAGAEPVLGSSVEAPLNTGRDWGTEVILAVTLPVWDHGVTRGRHDEAMAAAQAAQQQETVMQRQARLAWTRAAAGLASLYDEYQARVRADDIARDAYLQTESLYRGGQGRALDVLDAFAAWTQAGQDRLDAIYGYRAAQAELQRWGQP